MRTQPERPAPGYAAVEVRGIRLAYSLYKPQNTTMSALSVRYTKAPKVCLSDNFPDDVKELLVDCVFKKVNWHCRLVCKGWYVRFQRRLENGRLFHIPLSASSGSGRVRDYATTLDVELETYRKITRNPQDVNSWPDVSRVDGSCIIVVAGIQKGGEDQQIGHTWYVRVRCVRPAGQSPGNLEYIGKFRLRRLPSEYCDKLLVHYFNDKPLRRSCLITKYQPKDGNPFMLAENNGWRSKIVAQATEPPRDAAS